MRINNELIVWVYSSEFYNPLICLILKLFQMYNQQAYFFLRLSCHPC
jgi:hypothetical protein